MPVPLGYTFHRVESGVTVGNSTMRDRTLINFEHEAYVDQSLDIATMVLGVDEKRVHFIHFIGDTDSREVMCTVEQMLVHVDTELGRSSTILPDARVALAVAADAHEGVDIGLNPTMSLD